METTAETVIKPLIIIYSERWCLFLFKWAKANELPALPLELNFFPTTSDTRILDLMLSKKLGVNFII